MPIGAGLKGEPGLKASIRAGFGLAYHRGQLLASMNQRDDLGARTPGDWLARVRQGQDWRFPR